MNSLKSGYQCSCFFTIYSEGVVFRNIFLLYLCPQIRKELIMNKNEILKMRIDSRLKGKFYEICKEQNKTMSEVLESLIKKQILESSSK